MSRDKRLLLLFDIDGTLLVGDNGAHHAAIVAGLEEVYGLDLAGFSFMTLEPWGKTDLQIARDALSAFGVPEGRRATLTGEWLARADAQHAAISRAGTHPVPVAAPGAEEALRSLAHRALLGLVTGNIEPIARRKLAAAELGGHFVPGLGGFGSDHHDRTELVTIARNRAGTAEAHPREQTVIIGDTPRDIACARSGGVACIGVTTGSFAASALASADAVIPTLADLADALADLGYAEPPRDGDGHPSGAGGEG